MELGGGPQQESISLSTMPIPSMSYGSIHDSTKFKMLSGPGHASLAASINGPHQPNVSSSARAAAPVPHQLLARPPSAPSTTAHVQQLPTADVADESTSHARPSASLGGNDTMGVDAAGAAVCLPPAPPPGTCYGRLPPTPPANKPVRYRECLKNHAASIGGHALDGCGDFMPSGGDGSIEALKCAACGCHRNFHRREVEGELAPVSMCSFCAFTGPRTMMIKGGGDQIQSRRRHTPLMAVLPPPHTPLALPPPISPAVGSGAPPRTAVHIGTASVHSPPDASDHHDQLQMNGPHAPHMVQMMHHHHHFHSASSMAMKKRFRTKFSSEQKDKMFSFAETLGWRIQKHDEVAVHQFCADVGVKRHVFKVWMHNNKNTFGKKILLNDGGVAYLDNGASSPTTSSGNNNMQP